MRVFCRSAALSCCLSLLAGCVAPPDLNPDLSASIAWYTGAAGHVDDNRARLLLERAAASEDTLAIMWIARVHSTGRMGFARDLDLARQVAGGVIADVERLAKADVAEAGFLMGTAFAEGLGKTTDPVAAASWYERAALLGNMLAQHNMGNIYAAGTGVPEDELESVFAKFVQSNKTRTGAGGTGLGLSICREIIEAHQGRIWCENHPEGGAIFHVVLPWTMRKDPRGNEPQHAG